MDISNLPEFKDVSWRRIAYVSSFLIVISVCFSFFYEIELKQDVSGEIISQSEIKIQGVAGLVSDIYVQPGGRVESGTPLFRIDRDFSLSSDGRPRRVFDENVRDEQLRAANEGYLQHRAEIEVRLATLTQNLANRHQEERVLAQEIEQKRQMVVEAEKKLARLQSVEQYVVADRIEQARADVRQLRIAATQSAARKQQLLTETAGNQGTQDELRAQLKSMEAAHERELQDIRTRFERERQNSVISAPKAGVVSFSNVLPGRFLKDDDVAMVIATDNAGKLMAALRIPSRRRGFIRPGQIVRLKLDAFPYARFGSYEARISSISHTAVVPAGSVAAPPDPEVTRALASGNDGDYIAWAVLPGKSFSAEGQRYEILPGMRATASVVIERRTIAEWLLAPIFRMFRG